MRVFVDVAPARGRFAGGRRLLAHAVGRLLDLFIHFGLDAIASATGANRRTDAHCGGETATGMPCRTLQHLHAATRHSLRLPASVRVNAMRLPRTSASGVASHKPILLSA